jgi:tetratricopeptide (TPR) repeat protein
LALRTRRPKRRPHLAWLLIFLAVGAGALWVWGGVSGTRPRFQAMLLLRNGDPIRLLNGESLSLRPEDRVRIQDISTNVMLNRGVRLFCSGLDADALLYDEIPLHTLLPRNRTFDQHRFRVEVKRGGSPMGHVTLVVEPSVNDWITRASRIIDPEKRLDHLERALEHHPLNEEILEQIIEENMGLEKWEKAAAMLEKRADMDGGDDETLQRLLSVYESAGDVEGVLSTLGRLAELHPDDPVLAYRLAEELEDSDRTGEAVEQYERVLGLLRQDEDRAAVLKTLGYLYSGAGDVKRAIERYSEAALIEGEDANLFYNLAALHEKAGNPGKAEEHLKQAVALQKVDVEGRMELAHRALERGDTDEAEKYLNEVLGLTPDSLEAMLLLADVFDRTGDRERLRETYRKMLPLAPDNEVLVYNLAVLEYEAGKYADSEGHLERYLKSRPDDMNARELLFDTQVRLEKPDDALRQLSVLLDHDPSNLDYYHFAFDVLGGQDRWDELVPVLKRGLKAVPGHAVLTDYLILVYLKLKMETQAMDLMTEALEHRPGDTGLMLRLAELADRRGDEDRAAGAYRKIMKADPEHEEAKGALVRLLLERARRQEAGGRIDPAMATYMEVLEISPGNQEAEESYLRLRLEKVRRQG